jgi:hypothetical protein
MHIYTVTFITTLFLSTLCYGQQEVDLSYSVRANSFLSRIFPYKIPIENAERYTQFKIKKHKEKEEAIRMHSFYEKEVIRRSALWRIALLTVVAYVTTKIIKQFIYGSDANKKLIGDPTPIYIGSIALAASVDIARDFWPTKRDHAKAIEGISIGLSHKGIHVGASIDL